MTTLTRQIGRLLMMGLLVVTALVGFSSAASSHRDGCHAAHSCPSDTGSYVCGDTGNFSECGYSSIPEYEEPDYDAPPRPKISRPTAGRKGLIRLVVTAEAGSKLRVRSGGKTLLTATATGTSQILSFKGITGSRRYIVSATDSSGNTSSVAAFRTTADGTAPSIIGATARPGAPEDARSVITFNPGEPSSYVLELDGKVLERGAADASDFELAFPTANGRHQVVLKLVDKAGNVSTLEKTLNVNIPDLKPRFEVATAANEPTQIFKVTGTPGSTGLLRVGDVSKEFIMSGQTSDVAIDLADGSYGPPRISVKDQFGRKGIAELPAFIVDTVKPTAKITRLARNDTKGRLVALIGAEAGATVLWRILDEDGDVVRSATYLASGAEQTIDTDVDEGRYTMAVEVTDSAGNVEQDEFESTIGADPLTAKDWIIILILVALMIFGIVVAWSRRTQISGWMAERRHQLEVSRVRRAHEAALALHSRQLAAHQEELAAHRSALSNWNGRKAFLTELLEEARTENGKGIALGTLLARTKLKSGERVYSVVGGVMVEQRTRQNSPVIVQVEHGRVAVTNMRVLFQGDTKKREWAFDKLEAIRHINADTTMLQVSNRKSPSGVTYQEAERTRLHLELAIADLAGDRHQVVDAIAARLHSHETQRPTEPPAPPPAPPTPALLQSELETASRRTDFG